MERYYGNFQHVQLAQQKQKVLQINRTNGSDNDEAFYKKWLKNNLSHSDFAMKCGAEMREK